MGHIILAGTGLSNGERWRDKSEPPLLRGWGALLLSPGLISVLTEWILDDDQQESDSLPSSDFHGFLHALLHAQPPLSPPICPECTPECPLEKFQIYTRDYDDSLSHLTFTYLPSYFLKQGRKAPASSAIHHILGASPPFLYSFRNVSFLQKWCCDLCFSMHAFHPALTMCCADVPRPDPGAP